MRRNKDSQRTLNGTYVIRRLHSPYPYLQLLFLRCIHLRGKRQINFLSLVAHLEQCVRGVLLEEGATGPLPPGSSSGHLRLNLDQWIEPDGDGATPGQQALQLLQVSVAVATLCEVET